MKKVFCCSLVLFTTCLSQTVYSQPAGKAPATAGDASSFVTTKGDVVIVNDQDGPITLDVTGKKLVLVCCDDGVLNLKGKFQALAVTGDLNRVSIVNAPAMALSGDENVIVFSTTAPTAVADSGSDNHVFSVAAAAAFDKANAKAKAARRAAREAARRKALGLDK